MFSHISETILKTMVVFGVALVAHAHPRRMRSVADNPCGLVIEENPVETPDYASTIANLQTRSEGIELDAQGIKTQVQWFYHFLNYVCSKIGKFE